ncbi:MAG: hypothetical protein Kow0092_09130 [Deferrisomatales bacterium]
MTHTVAPEDLALFAAATGDCNPIHFDEEYAGQTFFKGRIAHGILSAGFVSAVIAEQLPGLGTIYVSQSLRFLAPVRIGDRVTTRVEVLDVDREKNRVRLRTTCVNQDGTVVLDGDAVVMPPKRKAGEALRTAVDARTEQTRAALARAVDAFAKAWQQAGGAGRGEEAVEWGALGSWLAWTRQVQEGSDRLWRFWTDRTVQAQDQAQELLERWMEAACRAGLPWWSGWPQRCRRPAEEGKGRPE